jgi:hypothetical protein
MIWSYPRFSSAMIMTLRDGTPDGDATTEDEALAAGRGASPGCVHAAIDVSVMMKAAAVRREVIVSDIIGRILKKR